MAEARIADVPELREVVLAHQRARQVEKVRGEAAADLARACFEAAQVASISLIARTIGVSRSRVQKLIDRGETDSKKKGAKKK